jgi:(p)ppGpp synthase/HD superfamily hydrolase
MHPYAQTIPQLYCQLQRAGYSVGEMCCIRDAYELAMVLFSGRFQASGKAFISHVVGTASILASLQLPAEVVAAGLLHNAYRNGDFGDGRRGISDARREQVRRVVGNEVEQYVAGFATLRWNLHTLSVIRDRPYDLDPIDRSVILLRLADHLEHLLDLDPLYSGNIGLNQYMAEGTSILIDTAENLGFTTLAAALRQAFDETRSTTLPAELCLLRSGTFGRFITPQSYHRRLSVEFRQLLFQSLTRLRSSTRLRQMVNFWVFFRTERNKV